MFFKQLNITIMRQINKIFSYLGLKTINTTINNTPNGWGHQFYNHYFRAMKKDHQLDLNNHTYRRGFIERFTSTYVNRAHLKNRINKFSENYNNLVD
jgi:hypothetical protein